MAVDSSQGTELLMPKMWNEKSDTTADGIRSKVAVVYYLSRNGQLEHPHFVEVPLSTSDGLYLRDVINKLNFLRGNRVAYMYSWSSKRSYKNGYVWQDLSENDLIHPTDGYDYVLKGSEMLQASLSSRSYRERKTSSLNDTTHESNGINSRRQKNKSWSSLENSAVSCQNEYRVFKCESSRELGGKQSDVSTQTEDKAWRSKSLREEYGNRRAELSREELSPPSMSSSDGASGSRNVDRRGCYAHPTDQNEHTSGGRKAPRLLMQLLTCGSSSGSVKKHGAMENMEKKRSRPMRMHFGTEL